MTSVRVAFASFGVGTDKNGDPAHAPRSRATTVLTPGAPAQDSSM